MYLKIGKNYEATLKKKKNCLKNFLLKVIARENDFEKINFKQVLFINIQFDFYFLCIQFEILTNNLSININKR